MNKLRETLGGNHYFIDDVLALFPFSRTTLYNWMDEGRFPQSTKVGHLITWRKDTVDMWLKMFKGK